MNRMIKGIKGLACVLSVLTMVMSPVAQGAEAKRSMKTVVKNFLNATQFNAKKPLTVREFHYRIRSWYPQPLRQKMDTMAVIYGNEIMPPLDVQFIKDGKGDEQARFLLTQGGQSISFTTGDDFFRVGSVKISHKDYYATDKMLKRLVAEEKSLSKNYVALKTLKNYDARIRPLSKQDLSRMNAKQKAAYLMRFRKAVEVADRVLSRVDAKKTSFFNADPAQDMIARWVVGEAAFAANVTAVGSSCVVAGFLGSYQAKGKGRSCGYSQDFTSVYKETFSDAGSCSGGAVPCNPIVYGFKSGSRNPHCVPSARVQDATRYCGEAAPIETAEQKRALVQSWSDNMDLSEGGKTAQQLAGLREFINSAVGFCDSADGQALQSVKMRGQKAGEDNDQKIACDEIRRRAFDLRDFVTTGASDDVSCVDKPGTVNVGGRCVCEEATPVAPRPVAEISVNQSRMPAGVSPPRQKYDGARTETQRPPPEEDAAPAPAPAPPAPAPVASEPCPVVAPVGPAVETRPPDEPVEVREEPAKKKNNGWLYGLFAVAALAIGCVFIFCKGGKDKIEEPGPPLPPPLPPTTTLLPTVTTLPPPPPPPPNPSEYGPGDAPGENPNGNGSGGIIEGR